MFWHPDVLLHDTGEGVFEAAQSPLIASPEPHPESAGRILNMKAMLERGPLAGALEWAPVRLHAEAELEMVHPPEYLDDVRSSAEAGGRRYTRHDGPRAPVVDRPGGCGQRRNGGRLGSNGAVLNPDLYARAPAGSPRPTGVCRWLLLPQQRRLAAETALRAGAERVAIVDFDVHPALGPY